MGWVETFLKMPPDKPWFAVTRVTPEGDTKLMAYLSESQMLELLGGDDFSEVLGDALSRGLRDEMPGADPAAGSRGRSDQWPSPLS